MAELVFQNRRIIHAENYKDLSPVHLKQMDISAMLGFGAEYSTAEQFLEQTGDGSLEDGGAEFWDVVAAENPDEVLYECWVYLGDTANVFFAGTAEDTDAAMCQWSFDDHSSDGRNTQLCADLQKAFDSIH